MSIPIFIEFLFKFSGEAALHNFKPILGAIAHNVPAVYDVWAGIKGLCEAKTARPNVPE
jgi:hypothetical protein